MRNTRGGQVRRYNRRRRRDRDDLDARLRALRTSGGVKKKRKRRSSFGPFVLGVLLIVGLLGVIYVMFQAVTEDSPQEAAAGEPVTIAVEDGDTLSSVADKLDEAGIVGNATLFTLEARMEGQSNQIKPGEYQINRGESSDRILEILTTGEAVSTFTVTIPEGLTVEQTAQAIEEQSGIPAEQFGNAAESTDYGYAFLEDPAIKSLEGFLFPKQYEFEGGTSAEQVINRLLEQYLLETQNMDFESAQQRLNLTEYELLTAASLIERESANPEERPVIASVIYNRMRSGMPLQIDATIQYALGEPKEQLSLQDLEINSPYNTYQNPGLPPGPIASPSRESIEAALNPAETDYLYYVLQADGESHYFTNDYDDFLRAKAEAGL